MIHDLMLFVAGFIFAGLFVFGVCVWALSKVRL